MLTLQDKTPVFTLAEHGDALRANTAAQRFASQFSRPQEHRSNGAPLIFCKWSKEHQGYVLFPNMDYYPNRAWEDLLEYCANKPE